MKKLSIIFFTIIYLSQSNLISQPNSLELEELARKLVVDCAGIKESENVFVSGSIRDIELLENIAVNVRKVGAFPLISIGSDRLTRKLYTDIPEKYDIQMDQFDYELTNIIHASIGIEIGEDEELLSDISPQRIAVRSKANDEIRKNYIDRKIRIVGLGNGLYPTENLAKKYKLTKKELTDIFWKGVNVDFKKLQTICETLKNIIVNGKTLRITTPEGTDLEVGIRERPIKIIDGVITEEDLKEGSRNVNVWLPSGEVYLAPNFGTAVGKIVIDKDYFQGELIEGLTVLFKDGKVESITAKSGFDRLKKLYDEFDESKNEFSFIDFGINPNVKIPEGSEMVAWMASGIVTVGIGNNIWAGGENTIGFGYPFFLRKATVTIDGKIIIENGELKF